MMSLGRKSFSASWSGISKPENLGWGGGVEKGTYYSSLYLTNAGRDLLTELVLHGHNDLNVIEWIQSQIVDEVRVGF